MKPILEIQNISKKYKIRHNNTPYLKFSDSIAGMFSQKQKSKEEFWALKNIVIDIKEGDTVGIIGNNGAGKSTLLKILSKITPPTSGKIISRGRIASLLEVGTGFHGELSGRENIFLNGSILGMKRTEIKNKFDEIVDFSGTEKFIDTALKHYSSGMQLRLAFAVAAFLEPEILIIDEVLAVGDLNFQKKCLNKIEQISNSEGRTIMMVSHDMTAIRKVCKTCILLETGEVKLQGSMNEVLSEYINHDRIRLPKVELANDPSKSQMIEIGFGIHTTGSNQFHFDEEVTIHIKIRNNLSAPAHFLGFSLKNSQQVRLFTLKETLNSDKEINEVTLTLPGSTFVPDNYTFLATLIGTNNDIVQYLEDPIGFEVLETGSPLQEYKNSNYGLIYLKDYKFNVK